VSVAIPATDLPQRIRRRPVGDVAAAAQRRLVVGEVEPFRQASAHVDETVGIGLELLTEELSQLLSTASQRMFDVEQPWALVLAHSTQPILVGHMPHRLCGDRGLDEAGSTAS